jgi:hypothetical protein
MLVGYSARRRVLIAERVFVTDYLLFGRVAWWRRRWQVREGDYLAVFLSGQAQSEGSTKALYWHALFVCHSRRRHKIADMYTNDRVDRDMEIAAHRVASLVDLPYEGYRESKGFWWT